MKPVPHSLLADVEKTTASMDNTNAWSDILTHLRKAGLSKAESHRLRVLCWNLREANRADRRIAEMQKAITQ